MVSGISDRLMRRGVRRGFTLIEIMVVIAIIVILVGVAVAVGTNLRQSAQVKQTKVVLGQLMGIHEDFVREGNAAPAGDQYTDADAKKNRPQMNMFPRGFASGATYKQNELIVYNNTIYRCVSATATGDPNSQPANWSSTPSPAIALDGYWLYDIQQYPSTKKALMALPSANLSISTYSLNGTSVTLVTAVQDGFSTAIGYVPPPAAKGPFFVSMGPDGSYSQNNMYNPISTTTAVDPKNTDNIHSFD